jgi:hypothetical protein
MEHVDWLDPDNIILVNSSSDNILMGFILILIDQLVQFGMETKCSYIKKKWWYRNCSKTSVDSI